MPLRTPSFQRLPLVLIFSALLLPLACRRNSASHHATTSPLEQALHADVDAGHLPSLHWPDFSDYKPLVESFYTQRNWNPAWVDGKAATAQAVALTKLFAASAGKGLNPDDYDAALWTGRLAGLSSASDAQRAEFDTAMTVAAMRYISDLHIGRVNPQHFAFGVDVQTKKYDLPNFVAEQVVDAGDVGDALKGVEPDSAAYRETEQALVHYQELAAKAGAAALPAPAQPLSAGASYAGAAALATRLQLLGDMSAGSSEGATYTQALSDGVKSFQTTHDLPVDGRLTPQTVAALNVPLDARVRQIEDTLERMRWLAPEYQNPAILVNIPEFVLRAYDNSGKEQFQMRVVVGQSLEEDHKTPVLVQEMKYIVLRPYWNVTPTIVKKEIVPHVEANKGYLEAKNFEVVNRSSGKPVADWTTAGLEHLEYMVREKPGPKNSLGLVKFMFPNKLNIYLHSTPATELFDHTRRDFSHGCIRLQEPEKLADWVLRDQPDWSPDKIHNAMENGEDNKNVSLTHPIPVLIFYETARVGEDGRVHFFNDIYGYDKDMEAVIAHGDPFPIQPEPKEQTSDTE